MTKNNFKFSVLAYFLISVVLHGLQRSCGLLVLILLQSLITDRQHATMPFAVSWAVTNIIASFSDSLIEKKKSGRAILFGVIMTALGAGLCVFSTDQSHLIVSWGFIFGSGYGIASPHLSKFLNEVNSPKFQFFTQATPSLGVLVMPYIIHSLASYYGLQSSYLIIAGIILNYLPLSIAAAFNVTFDLPNFNWRVRKKSNQYVVSKLESDKQISEESFINSLEPELILQINQNDEFLDETYEVDDFVLSMNEILSVGRKRTETRCHDLQSIETLDPSFMSNTRSLIGVVMQKNGKENKYIKSSLNNDTTYIKRDKEMVSIDEHTDEPNNSIDKLERTNLDLTSIGVVNKIPESTNENAVNNASSELCKENSSELQIGSVFKLESTNLDLTSIGVVNKIPESTNENAVNNASSELCKENSSKLQIGSVFKLESTNLDLTSIGVVNKIPESSNENAVNNASSELCKENSSELQIVSVDKSVHPECKISQTLQADQKNDTFSDEKEGKSSTEDKTLLEIKIENSSPFDNKLKIPFEIKVHVEECTFINDGKKWYENVQSTYEVDTKNSHNDPLNVLMPKSQVSFAGQKFSKSFHKSSECTMSKQLNIFTISEKIELDDKQIAKEKNIKDIKQNINIATTLKIKKILKFLNDLTSPACLCIILISIVFEFNLVVLITMFADFGNDIDDECSDLKWILAAFGAGGLAGKFCCHKISRTTPEKSHAIGVILFLLTGLSTAGLVFSTNLKWLAGFYSILGALEGGITYTIPKFVSQYVDSNMLSTFTFVRRFLSGVAVIGVPYAIGLSRDELDDYEFLLQVLSCSSVLCAFIVYFLPYLSTSSDRKLTSSKDKVETV